MERYTVPQRVFLVRSYYENGCSPAAAARKARSKYGKHLSLGLNTVKRLVQKFEATGSVEDKKAPGPPVTVRTEENIGRVQESVNQNPRTSTRRRAQELEISRRSLQRVLKKELHVHPYKISTVQKLQPSDPQTRYKFAQRMMGLQAENDGFFDNIIFSDEANFYLSGYVNRQNYRIWGSENPRAILEQAHYPEKVNVWCGFWSGGVIGPFFFENDRGKALTTNGERYRDMIVNFLWPELEQLDVSQMWFQQDGSTSHTAGETINLLRTKFQGRVISAKGDIDWPSRSPDLNPLDFFCGVF